MKNGSQAALRQAMSISAARSPREDPPHAFAAGIAVTAYAAGYNTEFRYRLAGVPVGTKAPALRVVFAGTVAPEELEVVARALHGGRCFLPRPLGLHDLRDPDLPPSEQLQPGWHELTAIGFTESPPNDKRPVRDFLKTIPAAQAQWAALPAPAVLTAPMESRRSA